jgi:uncharacterized protein YyaL (SSP411 family)
MPTYSNQLINETSPYLLQHAHNPVNWYAWGETALAEAKKNDKPILVSIGYAACHWCHVMEKESFENEAVAAIMNAHFINIKIDREERPDLDHIYMDAVQAIAGNGGWPLNVFLTSDGRPFYGGTYFPPQKAFNRPSWTDVLNSINDTWKNKRNEVEEQANQLVAHIKQANNFTALKNIIPITQSDTFFKMQDCKIIADNMLKTADSIHGGFGRAPKFPQTFCLEYLLQYAHSCDAPDALAHVELTLQKMIKGGIYDQLAGGLARYSTDEQWLAPHFEKMLYDNALLISVLCEAYQVTKNSFYSNAIHKTINFIMAEMKDKSGGYYAAIDADSEGIEGKFYTWQKKEIDLLLGNKSEMYCAYYDISTQGNWEHVNILNVNTSVQKIADDFNLLLEDFNKIIHECNGILLSARNKRKRPITDDKILLGWNALLLTALCKSFAALQYEAYKVAAIDLFDFIETVFTDKHTASLYHTYKNGEAKYPAFLDDYAYYIQACISLQEITGNQQYLHSAKALTNFVTENFYDEASEFLFFTNKEQTDIVVRKIEIYDSATPSANAIMLHNFIYLAIVFDERPWYNKAVNMLFQLAEAVKKYPGSFAIWASAYLKLTIGITEIALVGIDNETILKNILNEYLPSKILQSTNSASDMPLLTGKPINEISGIYICKNYSCHVPVKSVAEMNVLIKKS